jgi:hypothetical protein
VQAVPKKRGPQAKDPALAGVVQPTNNKRIPLPMLMMVTAILLTYVTTGVPFTVPMARTIAIGVFVSAGVTWEPSRSWTRRFLIRSGLSFRSGTQSAKKIPENFPEVKNMFLLKIIWTVWKFNLVPELFLNADETGVLIFPLPSKSWAPTGAQDVVLVARDEKRQFTVIPVIAACGLLLGLVQVIWQGTTVRCEPSADIKAKNPNLFHAHTASHWSSAATKEQLIDDIYDTYAKDEIARQAALQQKSVDDIYWCLLLDVHWTNRDSGMIASLKVKYPTLIILYIPANCTGRLQPLDVDFNMPFKRYLKDLACKWLAAFVTGQLAAGVAPDEVKVDVKKSALVEPYCSWIQRAHTWAARDKAMLKRSWTKTGITIAWEFDSPVRAEMLKTAKEMQEAGTLFTWIKKKEPHQLPGFQPVQANEDEDINEDDVAAEEEDEPFGLLFDAGEEEEKELDMVEEEQKQDVVHGFLPPAAVLEALVSDRRSVRMRNRPRNLDIYALDDESESE